jgi:antirestriction protein ArdC
MATAIAQPNTAEQKPRTEGRDFRQEVTDNIIRMLEQGVAPWQKPWAPGASALALGMPMNPTTDRAYRGGNAVHLLATQLQRGYNDPRWMTYKQASEQGWQVRRGEKGTHIEFWDRKPSDKSSAENKEPGERGNETEKDRDTPAFIHRVYTVFNAAQMDGIPAYEAKPHTVFEAVQAGEQIRENSGAKIAHDQTDSAFYSRATDSIHLPPKHAFQDAAGYYGTALHELSHWTGHPDRLNRSTLNDAYRFGDPNYAKEELRAELASMFLAAERGIPHNPEQHAAYVDHWIKALKNDKHEIFRAAQDASRATKFLIAFERERSVAEQRSTGLPAIDANGSQKERAIESASKALEQSKISAEQSVGSGPEAAHGSAVSNVKMLPAEIKSGIYAGKIVAATDQSVIQQVTERASVAHPKENLDREPTIGEVVRIKYSNGKGSVRQFQERSKGRERGR